MIKLVDFSWARPGGAAIKAAGFDGVLRYVPLPGDGGKGLTSGEIADYRANGLAIGLVFESSAQRPLDGHGAGVEDAQQCERSVGALGFPATLPIYFAVDWDAQEDQLDDIDDYLGGAASVLGPARIGVYGSFRVVEHCREAGTAAWYWQSLAWSGGKRSPWRHIYQAENGQTINGGEVDFNEAYGPEQGLWEIQEEEDMTPSFRGLQAIAWGIGEVEEARLFQVYDALVAAGFIDSAPVGGDPVNQFEVRRYRIAGLSVSDNADAAYKIVGG